MAHWLSKLILKWWGIRIDGTIPADCKKSIVAVVPHTSAWDFPLGILLRNAMKREIGFVAKDSLFRFPFGWFFYWLGGRPVNRSKSNNYVEAIAEVFRNVDRFHLSIAPEGTRQRVDKLKTGFYYMAIAAEVPIVLCKFDWENRVVTFREPFWPSGDAEKDFAFFYAYFKGVKGRIPENSFFPE